MNKLLVNIVTDLLAAVALTVMVATGIVIWFILPPGTNRTHWLWGMMRHEWGTLHAAASVVLLLAVSLHVILHWRWLVTNLCKRVGLGPWAARHDRLAGLGVVLVLVVPLAVFSALAWFNASELPEPLHPLLPRMDPAQPNTPVQRSSASIEEILAARCAECHREQRAMGGIRAESPDQLRRPQHGIRWVVSGDPAASPLFGVIGVDTGGSSPAPMHRVSAEELEVFRGWVRTMASDPLDGK